MAEYIERGAAINLIRTEGVYGEGYSDEERENDVISMLESLPATNVVEVVPELRKPVKILYKEYAKAKQNPVVRDPLAYALYQTWRFFDDRKNGR